MKKDNTKTKSAEAEIKAGETVVIKAGTRKECTSKIQDLRKKVKEMELVTSGGFIVFDGDKEDGNQFEAAVKIIDPHDI